MSYPVIEAVRAVVVNATTKTNWVMAIVECDDGRQGLGEGTLDGQEPQVVAEIESAARDLVGLPAQPALPALRPHPSAFGGLAHAAARSAIEQALWDLLGQRLGAPLSELLGGPSTGTVRLYANVNRGLLADRSPEAFARAAQQAVGAGFGAVKIAPFDGLLWEPWQERSARVLIDRGLARLHAVRTAIGDEIDLLVDCHGRFNPTTAITVIPQIELADPYWIEAPVPEGDRDGWRRVRQSTSARLAGGEFLVGLEQHRQFLEASGADVVMPDVKYCGGVSGLFKVAALAYAMGRVASPHNPSGPVSTLATAHVALATAMPLSEFAWGEIAWRRDLTGGGEQVEGGRVVLPARAGLGIRLDESIVAAHPFVPTPISPEVWER